MYKINATYKIDAMGEDQHFVMKQNRNVREENKKYQTALQLLRIGDV